MKKLLFFLAALPLLLASCGGSGLKPADPAITYGSENNEFWQDVNIRDCFKVEGGGVAITDIKGLNCNISATVTVKTVKTPDWQKGKELHSSATIEILNKDGAVILSDYTTNLSDLENSQEGDVATINVTLRYECLKSEAEETLKDAKYIRVSKLNISERVSD